MDPDRKGQPESAYFLFLSIYGPGPIPTPLLQKSLFLHAELIERVQYYFIITSSTSFIIISEISEQ